MFKKRFNLRNVVTIVFYFAIMVMINGCATFYQPMKYTGGYSDRIGDYEQFLKKTRENVIAEVGHEVLYEVRAAGNGLATEERMQAILLGRCGELALQNGCKYFYILQSNTKVSTTNSTSSNSFSYGGFGYNSGYSSNYNSSMTYTINKFDKFAVIYISKEMIDGWDYPYNAQRYYNAAKIYKKRNSY
jgi:hypothetical protein